MAMPLFAASDLHVNHPANKARIEAWPDHPDDWLILAGDLGERLEHLAYVLETLAPKFAQLIWVPGNHELWSSDGLHGQEKYLAMVELCHEFDCLTPEDPYPQWPGPDKATIVPMFLGYDYSFAPVPPSQAVAWAREGNIICSDERRILPEPFPDMGAWCEHRLTLTRARLAQVDGPTILINHWPLRLDLCRLFRIPRFTPWCGTEQTTDWHQRYNARLVISGHLHMRAIDYRDGVAFEEVSLGYPRHYRQDAPKGRYLRPVWPRAKAERMNSGPEWFF